MSLLVTIPSGSFFLAQHLTKKVALNTITDNEVEYGIKMGLHDVIYYRFLAVEEESKEWFHLAKILASKDKNIAFQLGTLYHIENDIPKALFWYKASVNLGHIKAKYELIDLYTTDKQYLLAKNLLLPLINEQDSLYKLVNLAVATGDGKLLNILFPLLKKSDNQELLAQLAKYQIMPVSSSIKRTQCLTSIQLFATSLEHLYKLEQLISAVEKHPINQYFCFETPRYVSPKRLDCLTHNNKAIQCSATTWSRVQPEVQTRYIGLMLAQGGANVDNGILYIDAMDDVDVFIHELSHLLGFIDEYALPKNHRVCQREQLHMFSHNIVVLKPYYEGTKKEILALLEKQVPWFRAIDQEVPLLVRVGDKWKVGTPSQYVFNNHNTGKANVGLFESETCKNTKVVAFKPTKIKTNLRYYEAPFITLYAGFLQHRAENFLMPSYHYNVAKSLFKNDEEVLGMKWLQKALAQEVNGIHEYNNIRYEKVKRGKY